MPEYKDPLEGFESKHMIEMCAREVMYQPCIGCKKMHKKYRIYEGKLYFSSKCKDCKDAVSEPKVDVPAPKKDLDEVLDF